jgi:hypothetical protein
MINYQQLFSKPGSIPSEYSNIAIIPKGSNIWPIFYKATAAPVVSNPSTGAVNLNTEPVIVDLVESTVDWVVRGETIFELSAEMMGNLEIELPIDDYKKSLDNYIPQSLPVLMTKLPEILYKEELGRVYVGFIFFIEHLTSYSG